MEQYICPHCNNTFSMERQPSDTLLYCPHCNGTVFLENDELQTGAVLGGFEIIKLLGKGGMGNVYLAKQSSMQRLVALKVLLKAMVGGSDKNIIEMFNKEIQLSGKLNHPNIIKAIDAGEDAQCYFMAITYVEGEDFEKMVDRGIPVPEKEAFAVALRISDALAYAWEKHGLLHKDIKPGNIMQDKKGEIFLMDMGIAQLNFGRSTEREKEVLGSPFYMSPEQGQGLPLDWRTDMYSLGATLYHMIVGVPPYDAKDVRKIIEKHITDPFPDPSTRNPNIALSKNTVSLLKKMMSKKTENRYNSWKEFDSAVKNAFFSAPKSSSKKGFGTAPKKSGVKTTPVAKKSKISDAVIFANVILVLAIAIVVAYFIYDHMKNKKAQESIARADKYFSRNQADFDEVLRLYSFALEDSKGTKHYPMACQKMEQANAKAKNFILKAKNFDEAYKKATELSSKRNNKEALDTMMQVRDIEDPARKQAADAFISQLQAVLNAKTK
ncbi:MAG TPA: hypothetical protein DCZ94_05395 [Lentisphaeria bacterium]|nr:MAG: hypothetical protein A2X48_00915 [Lentisphaerae bacterium GWF2_49_21]HBC86373.1 hypothetical protein [Lentisphaeria bacterium]